jgi:hypothetical protein
MWPGAGVSVLSDAGLTVRLGGLQSKKSFGAFGGRRGAFIPIRAWVPSRQNARIEHDEALRRVMTALLKDDTELFKQFSDNESFRRWLMDTVFTLTYDRPGGPPGAQDRPPG